MSRVKMLAPVPATIELLKEQLLARNHDLFPPVVLQSYIVRLEGYAEIDREDTILDVEDVIRDIKQAPYAFAPYINMYLFEGRPTLRWTTCWIMLWIMAVIYTQI